MGEYDFSGLPATIREEIEELQAQLALVEQQPTSETIADLGRNTAPVLQRLAGLLDRMASEGDPDAGRLARMFDQMSVVVAALALAIDGDVGDE